jgi:hypothetical protein
VSDNIRKDYVVQFYPTAAVNVKTDRPFKKVVVAKNGQAALDLTHIAHQDE